MRKWGLALMVMVMLAAPMVACGFPLPAGSTRMMAVDQTVCAKQESTESCQARQDAYQQMSALNSVVIPDLEMYLFLHNNADVKEITIRGSFEYVIADSDEGLGANLHAVITEGELTDNFGTQPFDGLEITVVGTQVYTRQGENQEWAVSDMMDDASTQLALHTILGLSGVVGSNLNLFTAENLFTVTSGEDEYEDQTMLVQTLEVDIPELVASDQIVAGLIEEGLAIAGDALGLDAQILRASPEQIVVMVGTWLPEMIGTEFTSTLYIGAEDRLIHYVEDHYTFKLEAGVLAESMGMYEVTYRLTGHLTQHNEPITITEPANAIEGQGLFGGERGLFGAGGLGDSLFGG